MLSPVSDQVLHIAIDVSFAEGQIQGHVCDGVRAPKPFSGWLGLIGELDGMLGSAPEDRGVRSSAYHQPKERPPWAGAPERRD